MALVRVGLRFDERIGLMGGEDIDFFGRAHDAGYGIRITNKAITRETAHAERQTYCSQIYRSMWCASSDVRMHIATRGALWTWARKAHTVPTQIVFGMLEIAASPLFLISGLIPFKRRMLAGSKKISKGIGRAIAFFGVRLKLEPYRNIVGN